MEVIGMDVQLIIKAPNQNVDDHIVYCNLDWTVQKLKNHLSRVYPSKPIIHEQKLIYSGRLLHDQLHLKDILRREQTQSSVHILHLVCSGQNSNQNMPQIQDPCSSQNLHDQPVRAEDSPVIPEASDPTTATILQLRKGQQASQSSYHQYYPHLSQNIPAISVSSNPQFIAQMATMQQMYAYYFTQYMQSMHTSGLFVSYPSVTDSPSSFQQNTTNAPNNTPNEIPVHRPINADPRMNAQGALDDNEEFGNRDWLEKFFLYCRFFILFSIVYFYSTPERLMIVIVLAILAFLYHEGWFVRRPNTAPPPNNQTREINGNAGERNPTAVNNSNEASPENQIQSTNETEHQNAHELEAAMDGDDPPHSQNSDMVNNNRILSPLTLIAAFFSSLIPEPPPPVNMN